LICASHKEVNSSNTIQVRYTGERVLEMIQHEGNRL